MLTRIVALGGVCGVKGRGDGSPGSAFWFSFPYRPDETTIDDVHGFNNQYSSKWFSGQMSGNSHNGSTPTIVIPDQSERDISDMNMTTGGGQVTYRKESPQQQQEEQQQSPTFQTKNFHGKETRVSPKGTPLVKILLTDDTQTIIKVAGRMLRTNGHPVETAVNGSQSLEKLKISYVNNDIDVLLTDLQMPVMDGIECTKRFRAWEEEQQCLLDAQGLPRRPRFLIVGMSANSDTQSKQEALDAGMDSFFPKPFNYQDFESIIRARCGT